MAASDALSSDTHTMGTASPTDNAVIFRGYSGFSFGHSRLNVACSRRLDVIKVVSEKSKSNA